MANLRVRFKINALEIEFEGEQEIVLKEYNQFKETLLNALDNKLIRNTKYSPKNKKSQSIKTIPKRKEKKKSDKFSSKIPKLNNSLNLIPKEEKSLKEFYSEYSLKSNMERNVFFIYYLKMMLHLNTVSMDDVFTCYKAVKARVPKQLYQSLIDTKMIKGWIDTKSIDNISITVTGQNFIEHDLKKKGTK